MGKSLQIRRMSGNAERIKVPLLHRKVDITFMLSLLRSRPPDGPARVVHIDISPLCTEGVESLVLAFLLGELSDGDRVWRRDRHDLVLIEFTCSSSLLGGMSLLPQIWCKPPHAIIGEDDGSAVDRLEMQRWARTAQLLERLAAGMPLEFKTDREREKQPHGRIEMLTVL